MERLADGGNSVKKKALLVFVLSSSGADEIFSESRSKHTPIFMLTLSLCCTAALRRPGRQWNNSKFFRKYDLHSVYCSRILLCGRSHSPVPMFFLSAKHVCESSVYQTDELRIEMRLLHFNWILQFDLILNGGSKQVQNCKNCCRWYLN